MLKKKNIITNDIFTLGPVFIVYFSRSSSSFFKNRIAHRFFISESFLLQVRKKKKTPFDLKIILKRRKQIETRAKKFSHVRHETICAIMSRKFKRQEN
jgi:hypothetical protein